VDLLDQQPHPVVERLRFLDAACLAHPALGGVLGGAALGRIDHFAREQFRAHPGEIHRRCQRLEIGNQRVGQMGFGPVEQDSAVSQLDAPGEFPDPPGIGEQLLERLSLVPGQSVPDRPGTALHRMPFPTAPAKE
jgi:hypothetical protein